MSTNDIYIRLRQECSQAVLSGCLDLILECRGKAKMAYELGAVNPEDFNELWKLLNLKVDDCNNFKKRMAAYAQANHRRREEQGR